MAPAADGSGARRGRDRQTAGMLDHQEIIRAEAEALAVAGEGADGATAVPATDWTLDDLLDHVGRLTWYWSGRVRKAGDGDFYDTDRPEGTSRSDWIRQGTALGDPETAAPVPPATDNRLPRVDVTLVIAV